MESTCESTKMCLAVLRSAKTDSDKFAALSVIIKVVKAGDIDSECRKHMFEAIGFEFIDRLFATKDVPEGCPPYIYQALGLSLLAYFCTDSELVQHSQILSKVDDLTELVLRSGTDDDERKMVTDAVQCLMAILSVEAGRRAIVEKDVVHRLCKVVKRYQDSDEVWALLFAIVTAIGKDCWRKHPESFHVLLGKLVDDFVEDNSERKFDICQKLTVVMYTFSKAVMGSCDSATWPRGIHRGLSDILFSKVPVPQMDPALKLASIMTEKLGVYWTFGETLQSKQFFLIFVHLVCIEVRMITEDRTIDQVLEDSSLLTACFSALENIIGFLVVNEAALENDHKQQLYSAITSAMNAVVSFLSCTATSVSSVAELEENKRHLVIATVRVTGAWLAEETAALRDEVYEILPFLMHVAKYSFELSLNGKSDVDVTRFLLPSLCHLTAEDKSRAILLHDQFHRFLLDYFNHHWKLFVKHNKKGDCETTLITMCGIYMNVVVLEGSLVVDDPVFHELLQCIFKALPELENGIQHLVLIGNLAVLGLLLLRHFAARIKSCETLVYRYLSSSIKFLWDAHDVDNTNDFSTVVITHDYKKVWPQVMELWFLGMQALSSLLPKIPWITQFILESGWVDVIVKKLHQTQEGAIEGSIKSAYEHLLCCLVDNGDNVLSSLKDQGALQACTVHKMKDLKGLLTEN